MSFGGSVLAMIISLRNNARPKRTTFFDRKVQYNNVKTAQRKKARKEQLNQTRLRVKAENRKGNLKSVLALILSIVIFVLIIGFIYWSLNK